MLNGSVPYRDFWIEYPVGALPTFILPAIGHEGDSAAYNRWFDRLMALCGCLALAGVALCLRALRASPLRTALALGLVALSPLLLGSVVLSRYDMWPAGLAAVAIAALLCEKRTIAAVLLASAISAKLWPAVIAPIAIAWIWQNHGPRAVIRWTSWLVGTLAVIFLPFFVLAPGATAAPIRNQFDRPLQIESLGAAVLMVAHHLAHMALTFNSDYASVNISGSTAHAVELLTSVLEAASVALVWILFARGPATRERLVHYSAAAVACFVAFGKVLSPQFVIWLIPLVALVRGRVGVVAGGVLAAVLALTQSWFPRHYVQLQELAPTQVWELLARDACLVALASLLVVRPRRVPVVTAPGPVPPHPETAARSSP